MNQSIKLKPFHAVACVVASILTLSVVQKVLSRRKMKELRIKQSTEHASIEKVQKANQSTYSSNQTRINDSCGVCTSCEESPMLGSMKPYQRHVIICSGTSDFGVSHIEKEEGSFAKKLQEALIDHKLIQKKGKKNKKDHKHVEKNADKGDAAKAPEKEEKTVEEVVKIKLTASSETSLEEGKTDVLVYPEALRYQLTDNDISAFVQQQLVKGEVCEALSPLPVQYKHLILVCTHAQRDRRCGRAGPQIIDKFLAVLKEKGIDENEVCVRASSHIGGHTYAGTLIVYPEGDWYGQISKRNAEELIIKYLSGERWKKCWRGNMSLLNW
mmetsp:Transcript_8836/g.10994  ORF Transcript_8836/g.10994 Transcript_8836/m.10994 type:complete len:327 (-) Transcript_8836:137-1117(-)